MKRNSMKPARICAGLLVVSTLAMGVTGCSTKTTNTTANATPPTVVTDNSSTLYTIPEGEKHKIDKEKEEAIKALKEQVDKVYQDNGVVNVVVGAGEDGQVGTQDDNYILQMYNDKRQCYTEASNNLVSFYYDTGKSIMASTKIEEVSDVTVLNIVEGILNLCEAGVDGTEIVVETSNVTVGDLEKEAENSLEVLSPDEQKAKEEGNTTAETQSTNKDEVVYTETVTTLTVTGFDNIHNVYAQFSQKQADDIIKSWEGMYTTSGEVVEPSTEETTATETETEATTEKSTSQSDTSNTEETTAETTEVDTNLVNQQKLEEGRKSDKLLLSIYTTSEGGFSVACQMEVEGQEYTSWLFDGYIPLHKSWDAGDGWKSGLSEEEYLVLMQKVQDNISTVMTEWNEESAKDVTQESNEATEAEETEETSNTTETSEAEPDKAVESMETTAESSDTETSTEAN